jgi:hypothetical protein
VISAAINVAAGEGPAVTRRLRFDLPRGARRALLALVLAFAQLPLSGSVPALAQRTPPDIVNVGPVKDELIPEPAVLLQVVIHSLKVKDDRETFLQGDADLKLTTRLYRCGGVPPEKCLEAGPSGPHAIAQWVTKFDAGQGETKSLERLYPLNADILDGDLASEELGVEVYAGQQYMLEFLAIEEDFPSADDYMGVVQRVISSANGWGVGSYQAHVSTPDPYLLCAGSCDRGGGDYEMTYEIRATPLPDLTPTNIRFESPLQPVGNIVCIDVKNAGSKQASAFYVNLFLDGAQLDHGQETISNLEAGGAGQTCVKVDLPTSGTHKLTAIVDQTQQVRESNESNNRLEQTKLFARLPDLGTIGPGVIGPVDGGTGSPMPDLGIQEIRVRGKNPSGANDCDPGDNDVVVVVNDPDSVFPFTLRLVVDDKQNQALERTVGQGPSSAARLVPILEIRFEDVRLNQGEHSLTATVDPANAIAESNEGNNSKTITVSCRNE